MRPIVYSLAAWAILQAQIHTAEALSLSFRLIKLDDHLVQRFISCYPAVQMEMKHPVSRENGSPRRVVLDRCGLPKNVDWGQLEFAVAVTLAPEDMGTALIFIDEKDRALVGKTRSAGVSEVYAANQAVLKKHRARLKPIISTMK